jgi:hypothetical protein
VPKFETTCMDQYTHQHRNSRFYTTVNMVHTMESLLGLPPMNQNDAYATGDGPSVFRTG